MPLLAALIAMLVSYTSGAFTDPLGGFGSGIFAMIVQIVYLFSFGVAVIQASNIQRGFKTTFDDAWEEARRKAGGILMAAIGLQFLVYVAIYIGSLLGSAATIVLQMIAYFFLILAIPAAAIGGLPGGLAISGSFRSVRANPAACIILAVVFIALWVFLPMYAATLIAGRTNDLVYQLVLAAIHALVLAYLAFPFSSTYDDIAFRG